MRDKLIELIGDAPYGLRTLGQAADELISVESIADFLIANGVTFADVHETNVGKWIPVGERLPKEWEDVLVLSEFGMSCVAVYLGDCGKKHVPWRVSWNHDFLDGSITHWMPMPEPPKEGE